MNNVKINRVNSDVADKFLDFTTKNHNYHSPWVIKVMRGLSFIFKAGPDLAESVLIKERAVDHNR